MHVDVLERRILGHAGRLIFVLDPVEPLLDRVGILLGDDALGGEHRGMGRRRGDVLAPQAACRSRSRHLSRASAPRGPSANRPPHMALELPSLRLVIASSPRPRRLRRPAIGKRPPSRKRRRRRTPRAAEAAARQGPRPVPRAARRRPTIAFRGPGRRADLGLPISAAGRCWSISGRPGAGRASSRCRRSTRSRRDRRGKLEVHRGQPGHGGAGGRSTDFFGAREFAPPRTLSRSRHGSDERAWRRQTLPTTILYDAEGRRCGG